jgi:hypothetical protein
MRSNTTSPGTASILPERSSASRRLASVVHLAPISEWGEFRRIFIPLLFSPNPKPGSRWMFGGGVTFVLPTATVDGLGSDRWQAGPALVGVYKTKKITTGALGQYWWSFASRDSDKPDASHGSLPYFFFYNRPNAWQIGFNPTITYNNKAACGDQWNVPVGLTGAKTTKIGKLPIKFQLGVEYSVVSQDSFGGLDHKSGQNQA